MNIVQFRFGTERVEVDFGSARAPVTGESVTSTGTDPDFPAGTYKVTSVRIEVGLRGPQKTICSLRKVTSAAKRTAEVS